MVTHNYVLISLKMYAKTYNNTSGNVLKSQSVQTSHKSTVTHMVTRGSP